MALAIVAEQKLSTSTKGANSVTKHVSIDEKVLLIVLKHINGTTRKRYPTKSMLFIMNENGYRKGKLWLKECSKLLIFDVKLFTNTEHI